MGLEIARCLVARGYESRSRTSTEAGTKRAAEQSGENGPGRWC